MNLAYGMILPFLSMTVLLATLNVRGLKNKAKRSEIVDFCNRQRVSILLLQETHACGFHEAKSWAREFNSVGFWSFGSRNSCGVGILLSKQHSWKPKDFMWDNKGRLVSITIEIPDTHTKVRIINVYGPNDPNKRKALFSSDLENHCMGCRNLIMGGDFNCIQDPKLDSKATSIDYQGVSGRQELGKITKKNNLLDCWRSHNPVVRRFTWHSSNNLSATRIDRIYMSRELCEGCSSKITACPHSDHDLVSVQLQRKVRNVGKGYWKLNTSHLKNPSFCNIIQDEWKHWKQNKGLFVNLTDWWEQGKVVLKNVSIQFATGMARERKANRVELLRKINSLQNQIDGGDLSAIEELKTTCKKFRALLQTKPRNPTIHPLVYGEESTFRPRDLGAEAKRMQQLRTPFGEVTSNPSGMVTICRRYYQQLYTAGTVDPKEIEFLANSIDESLSSEEQLLLEGPITLEETKRALFSMGTGKTPGSDGLPAEFYKEFFNVIGNDMCEVINDIFQQGQLSPSQRTGLITLIFKNKGSPEDLTNWRPISLLNVDYKIITKILASRVQKILASIIHENQTCSVTGRSISDNAHLLRNIQDYVDQKNLSTAFVSLDQQKAFDKVDWQYLQQILNSFHFGPNFCKWIQILYSNITSCIICNGHISEPFGLSRGVRQGCPLSPILYILAIEPLAAAIRADKRIRGLKLPAGVEVKLSMYADDATLILSDDRSIVKCFQLVNRYERASGASLNPQKTKGVFLGRHKYRLDGPVDINWGTSVKIIGIPFGYGDSVKKAWEEKLKELQSCINQWQDCDFTMKGRVTVTNNHILSKIWYLAQILLPSKRVTAKINKLIFPFIWENGIELVNRETMSLPPASGGMGVIDIATRVKTLQGAHLANLISGKGGKWRVLAHYWCGLSLWSVAPSLARGNQPLCHSQPSFYRSVLQNFRENKNAVTDWHSFDKKEYTANLLGLKHIQPRITKKYPGKNWSSIWERTLCARLTNKQISFNFKVVHNVLPTGSRLQKRGVDPGRCPHCSEIETLEHIFTNCKMVKPVAQWLCNYLKQHNSVCGFQPSADFLMYSVFNNTLPKKIEIAIAQKLSIYRRSVWLTRNEAKVNKLKLNSYNLLCRLKNYIW